MRAGRTAMEKVEQDRAQVVQAATKWKRMALKQFGCRHGEGIRSDMKAVRKAYFLDHDHSCYVDQWDWERIITAGERNLDFLKDTVRSIWKVISGAAEMVNVLYPQRGNAAQYRRRHRAVRDIHVPAPSGTPWRGQRERLARSTDRDLCQAQYPSVDMI